MKIGRRRCGSGLSGPLHCAVFFDSPGPPRRRSWPTYSATLFNCNSTETNLTTKDSSSPPRPSDWLSVIYLILQRDLFCSVSLKQIKPEHVTFFSDCIRVVIFVGMNTLSLSFDVCLDDKKVWDTSVVRVGLRYKASDSLVQPGERNVLKCWYWYKWRESYYVLLVMTVRVHKGRRIITQICSQGITILYRPLTLFFLTAAVEFYRGLPTLGWILKRFIEGKVVRKSDRNSNPGTRVHKTVTSTLFEYNKF